MGSTLVSHDYDVVTVYRRGTSVRPIPKQSILIPKPVYDRDLSSCLAYEADAVRQFHMDIFRSDFRLDGRKVSHIPTLDERIVRYCTQSVMGLPVTLLWGLGMVADGGERMTVLVDSETTVSVHKRLRVLDETHPSEESGMDFPTTKHEVDVSVLVSCEDDLVEVEFVFRNTGM